MPIPALDRAINPLAGQWKYSLIAWHIDPLSSPCVDQRTINSRASFFQFSGPFKLRLVVRFLRLRVRASCSSQPFSSTDNEGDDLFAPEILSVLMTPYLGSPISLWSKSLSNLQSCGSGASGGYSFTYFRPDMGKNHTSALLRRNSQFVTSEALQPFDSDIAQVFLHFPTCLVRVARGEKIQSFSIVLAWVDIAITIQAYISTRM